MMHEQEKKILFWSPMLSHVGTLKATIEMAESFYKYENYKVFILNIFGEFNEYKNSHNFFIINISNIKKFIPKIFRTGFSSKIIIYFFIILLIPIIIFKIKKINPQYFIVSLMGYLALLLKLVFFNKIFIINSIQGYPKLNFLRKLLWKFFYNKSNLIITMTNKTKEELVKKINIEDSKIIKIDNPIISRSIRIISKESFDNFEKIIFTKKVFCSVGRLTKQKNYLELLVGLKKYFDDYDKNFNLIIIGEGETREQLNNYIKKNNIKNFFLLGFKKNPFKYIARSNLYISSSLWEEPGHTLIEAGYLNVPIVTTDCPNGPKEIIIDGFNGFKYQQGNINDFLLKINKVNSLERSELYKILVNMKKTTKDFTKFRFINKLKNYVNF
jgi:glycosyltransferase involved in cell wall biosynthesis